jgi:hypothetical protein
MRTSPGGSDLVSWSVVTLIHLEQRNQWEINAIIVD